MAVFLGEKKLVASWIQILAYVEDHPSEGGSEGSEPSLSEILASCSTASERATKIGLGARFLDLISAQNIS